MIGQTIQSLQYKGVSEINTNKAFKFETLHPPPKKKKKSYIKYKPIK